MKYKTIKIKEEAYEKIKTYCNKHNLKISSWCEVSILENIERTKEMEESFKKYEYEKNVEV